jgi:serine/threonine protein kinase
MALPEPPPATLDNGRFVLLEKLGQGGMAVVWRARDTRLRVDRAIKILAGAQARGVNRVNRLQAEARAMARLDHRHIVKIQDVLDTDQGPAIVMDYIEGRTLDELRRRTGALGPRSAVRWMIQILDGLDHAHAVGIIHRDVKPSNIMVNAAGDALLADFGIALVSTDEDRFTRTNISMGSVAFMAPEQRLDARGVGPSADVYAAATSLYDLVTGSTPIDLFTADLRSPRWMDVPDALRQVLFDASRLDPERRTPTAAAFKAALERIEPSLSDVPFLGADPALGDTLAGLDGGLSGATARPSAGTMVEAPPEVRPRFRARWLGPLLALVFASAVIVSMALRMGGSEGVSVPLVRHDEPAPAASDPASSGPDKATIASDGASNSASDRASTADPSVGSPPGTQSPSRAERSAVAAAERVAPVQPAAELPAPTPTQTAEAPSLSLPRKVLAPEAWKRSEPASHEGPSGKWMGTWQSDRTNGRAYMTMSVAGGAVSCELWLQESEAPAQYLGCTGTYDSGKGILALKDLEGTPHAGTYRLTLDSERSAMRGMFTAYQDSGNRGHEISLSLRKQ